MSENDLVAGAMRVAISIVPRQGGVPGVVIPTLVHGSTIMTVTTGNEELQECDAIISENRSLTLGIKTADCAPVCFADGKRIGIAHVGWRGLCLGLPEKMLAAFDSTAVSIFVGPFLHSFKIRKDFCYDQITQKFEERYIEPQGDILVFKFLDALKSVLPSDTRFDARDMATNLSLPSHRRGNTSERLVTTVSFA